jgi:hypothetical protein
MRGRGSFQATLSRKTPKDQVCVTRNSTLIVLSSQLCSIYGSHHYGDAFGPHQQPTRADEIAQVQNLRGSMVDN